MKKTINRIGMNYSIIAFIVLLILTASCTNDTKLVYDTNCNQKELAKLRGEKLALLIFEHNSILLQGSEILNPTTANAVSDAHKSDFITKSGKIFTVKDITSANAIQISQPYGLPSSETIKKVLLEEGEFDGGILVSNSYGYQMSGPVLEKGLEKIFPKDWVGVTFGPSNVEFYYFASNTYIVNKEGKAIWNFYGKAAMLPVPLTGTAAEEADNFMRSVVGLDPSDKELAKASIAIASHYTKFLVWLIDADINQAPNKNYFSDYPGISENKHIVVYPAYETAHVPFTSTLPPVIK